MCRSLFLHFDKGAFNDTFVGEGLAPPGHFAMQNDIAVGDAVTLRPQARFGTQPPKGAALSAEMMSEKDADIK
ncbi:MAG: hypothetical protein IJN67_06205 [Oscillospiraceae bacterium]|nr:hypothetical protein [Oscillospiraceae bacterium]